VSSVGFDFWFPSQMCVQKYVLQLQLSIYFPERSCTLIFFEINTLCSRVVSDEGVAAGQASLSHSCDPPRVFTWGVAKLARARPSVTKHVGGLSIFFCFAETS
jgi:hypothetical protein